MTKTKTPVGAVLAYTLTVGYGDAAKVKLSWMESWAPGSTDVQAIAVRYGELGTGIQAIAARLPEIIPGLAPPLQKELDAIRVDMTALEQRDVPAETDARTVLNDVVTALAQRRGDLQAKLDKALGNASTALPIITTTQDTITVHTGTAVGPASFGADAGPYIVRLQDKSGKLVDGYSTVGDRTPQLVVAATLDNQPAARAVKVLVKPRPQAITVPPGLQVVWGTAPSLGDLGITWNGPISPEFQVDLATLAVGPATVPLTAKGDGKTWAATTVDVPLTVLRAPRWIEWTPPVSAVAEAPLTIAGLGAKLFAGTPSRKTPGPGTLTVTQPAGAAFPIAGKSLDLTVEAAETPTHAAALITAKVKVERATPTITWAAPGTAVLGTVLGPAQLTATIDPPGLQPTLVYNPAAGHALGQAGTVVLAVRSAESASHTAAATSVRLLVAVTAGTAAGADAMLDGSAFGPLPAVASRQRLAEWNASDPAKPAALGTMGPALMARISTMTSVEVLDFINTEHANGVHRAINGANTIISYPNGLEIRHKANGGPGYGHRPTVCMEVRMDPSKAVSAGQFDIAFKVTLSGKPAAKGPAETKNPAGGAVPADFLDGAMATTHLRLQ